VQKELQQLQKQEEQVKAQERAIREQEAKLKQQEKELRDKQRELVQREKEVKRELQREIVREQRERSSTGRVSRPGSPDPVRSGASSPNLFAWRSPSSNGSSTGAKARPSQEGGPFDFFGRLSNPGSTSDNGKKSDSGRKSDAGAKSREKQKEDQLRIQREVLAKRRSDMGKTDPLVAWAIKEEKPGGFGMFKPKEPEPPNPKLQITLNIPLPGKTKDELKKDQEKEEQLKLQRQVLEKRRSVISNSDNGNGNGGIESLLPGFLRPSSEGKEEEMNEQIKIQKQVLNARRKSLFGKKQEEEGAKQESNGFFSWMRPSASGESDSRRSTPGRSSDGGSSGVRPRTPSPVKATTAPTLPLPLPALPRASDNGDKRSEEKPSLLNRLSRLSEDGSKGKETKKESNNGFFSWSNNGTKSDAGTQDAKAKENKTTRGLLQGRRTSAANKDEAKPKEEGGNLFSGLFRGFSDNGSKTESGAEQPKNTRKLFPKRPADEGRGSDAGGLFANLFRPSSNGAREPDNGSKETKGVRGLLQGRRTSASDEEEEDNEPSTGLMSFFRRSSEGGKTSTSDSKDLKNEKPVRTVAYATSPKGYTVAIDKSPKDDAIRVLDTAVVKELEAEQRQREKEREAAAQKEKEEKERKEKENDDDKPMPLLFGRRRSSNGGRPKVDPKVERERQFKLQQQLLEERRRSISNKQQEEEDAKAAAKESSGGLFPWRRATSSGGSSNGVAKPKVDAQRVKEEQFRLQQQIMEERRNRLSSPSRPETSPGSSRDSSSGFAWRRASSSGGTQDEIWRRPSLPNAQQELRKRRGGDEQNKGRKEAREYIKSL